MMQPTSTEDIQLQLDGFNGPLDLLLHLVRKHKLQISEISIADITRQYAAYLRRMEELNLDIAGDYFVMASTLMLMKAKSMIPREKETFDEMKEELIFQLEEYEKVMKAAQILDGMHQEFSRRYPRGIREQARQEERTFELSDNAAFLLVEHYARVIERVKAMRPVIVKPKPYTMKDVLDLVFDVFRKHRKVRFSEMSRNRDRGYVVYLFVSLLELIRDGNLAVSQTGNFEEIVLIRRRPFDEARQQELVMRFE